MQISNNTTGMLAGITMATDKDGRDHWVVVVKGTFTIAANNSVTLAEKQEALVYADQHNGNPSKTSIKYECDFSRIKPHTDVILNGFAHAPNGGTVTEITVRLEVQSLLQKEIRVTGDRCWERSGLGFTA